MIRIVSRRYRSGLVLISVVLITLTSCSESFTSGLEQDVAELEQINEELEQASTDFENASKLLECKLRSNNTVTDQICEDLYGNSVSSQIARSQKTQSTRPRSVVTVAPANSRLKSLCPKWLELTDSVKIQLEQLFDDPLNREKTVYNWPSTALIAYNSWSRFMAASAQALADDLVAGMLISEQQVKAVANLPFDFSRANAAYVNNYVVAFDNVFSDPCQRFAG